MNRLGLPHLSPLDKTLTSSSPHHYFARFSVQKKSISIVGFGLVLAKFFSPTNTVGSVVAFTTTGMSATLLVMCTNRYFHIVWMLDHKKFEADHLTPILVTALMGCLLALLLMGGMHSKLVDMGCIKLDKNESKEAPGREMLLPHQHPQNLHHSRQREDVTGRDGGAGSNSGIQSQRSSRRAVIARNDERAIDDQSFMAVTSALAGDAMS